MTVLRNSLARYTARHLRIRRLVQFILADPVYNNALKNRAALLCRACGNLTACVAERYLILRKGGERHAAVTRLPYPISERSHVGNLRQIRKQGKGRSSKRKGNRRCPFLFAPAAGAALSRAPQSATPRCISAKNSPPVRVNRLRGSSTPLNRCRKRCRPSGTNQLTQFVCPSQPVQKKVPPVRVNRLRGSSTPFSRCRKRCRPLGTNQLTQFVCPSQPVQKKVPPVRVNRLRGSSTPLSRCRKRCRPSGANMPAAVRAPCSAGAEFTNRNFRHFRR